MANKIIVNKTVSYKIYHKSIKNNSLFEKKNNFHLLLEGENVNKLLRIELRFLLIFSRSLLFGQQ